MEKTLKKVIAIDQPTRELDSLKLGGVVYAPNFQRESINGTVRRLKDRSSKRFSCTRVNDDYFFVKRVR
jgi:hypothetical protein